MILTLAILTVAAGLTLGQPASQCCKTKMVDGKGYTLAGTMDTQRYNCLNDCIYERDDQPNSKYCFAAGNKKVECLEGVVTPPGGGGSGEGSGSGFGEGSGSGFGEGSGSGMGQGSGSGSPPPEESTPAPGPVDCKCGVKKSSRIVGGEETEVNEYPWMAALADSDENIFCGSTLIGTQWVVTASHCLFRNQDGTDPWAASELRIVLGEHDILDQTESTLPRKVVTVEKILTHEDYDASTSANDVALLKLADTVDINTFTPACLANTGDDFVGSNAWVYGWGAISSGGISSDKLLEVEVPIVNTTVCQQAMGEDMILPGMLCAGGQEGKDGCQGDSGGPLTVDISGQHTLVGDVSWGNGCGLADQYGVYAETAYYRAWIDTNIENNGGITVCTTLTDMSLNI